MSHVGDSLFLRLSPESEKTVVFFWRLFFFLLSKSDSVEIAAQVEFSVEIVGVALVFLLVFQDLEELLGVFHCLRTALFLTHALITHLIEDYCPDSNEEIGVFKTIKNDRFYIHFYNSSLRSPGRGTLF